MNIDAVIPAQILLVEDSPGDIRLTREALRDAKIANELQVVGDGEAALDFLHQRGPYADMPRPDIVLLDLNLPRKDGREVLQEMKADEELRRIPVIVLTTSVAEGDVLCSYDLHVNAFVTKPLDLAGFVQVVRSIESFWLSIVRLPTA
jgi:chemotaxis family two-component system response regulator Rcp1